MKTKNTPQTIYDQYSKGVAYNTSIDLYNNVKLNQNFYLGKQWEGVNAPDIEKPVINLVRQAVDYYISMLASDDIGLQPILPDDTDEDVKKAIEYLITDEMDKVFESVKFKQVLRDFLKDCALDGSHALYFWYDPDKENETDLSGGIRMIKLDSTNVIFGDPTEHNVELQPYIIVVQNLPRESVIEMYKANQEEVEGSSDGDLGLDELEGFAREVNKYVTVLTKFYKNDKGIVQVIKSTNKMILMEETSLEIAHYPIAWMTWRKKRNSYHGESSITPVRSNQIMINKYFMMINEFVKKLAFPKVLYDKTKLSHWNNRIEALGVQGDPREVVFTTTPPASMGQEVITLLENLITKTKDSLGIYDAAVGNVRPDNTSAIIAVQKAASQPLELQKMDYYQLIEDAVRIMLDLMSANYGIRPLKALLPVDEEEVAKDPTLAGELVEVEVPFNFADLGSNKIQMVIEVGAATYWSELMQTQTIDNMFRAGIIPDAITYVEQMPNGIIKSKQDIIDAIQKAQQAAQAAAQAEAEAMQGMQQAENPQAIDIGGAMQQ